MKCPYPNKHKYNSRSQAQAALLKITPRPGQLYMPSIVYRCKCGKWHLSRSGAMGKRMRAR